MELEGSNALITGGGRGIGKAVAAELLRRGATVTVLEIEKEHITVAQEELAELSASGERLAFHLGSVTSADDVDAAFGLAADRFGPVGLLVNNAGTAALAPVVEMTEESWDLIVDTCLKGTFLCTRAYARAAIAADLGGAVVNISSLNAIAATDGLGHYCAAKAGVSQFTKVCAGELGRHDIRVNAIAPGTTRTPLGEGFTVGRMGEEFLARTLVGRTPRHGEAQDIADVTAFLLSDLAARITGVTIPVDGGGHVRGLFSYWDVAKEEGLV
ncbi:MAG: SDR family oxidoreductase [Actinobacteria bacterium]|nr:SDR family oxidoreductase [Actinomycetota bacterium]